MPKLEITEVRVDDLLPYAGNAKIHTREQVEQIAASIEEFGNNDPIAVWRNGDGEPEIVEGHGRLSALKMLGYVTCPVIYLDHLTDEQRRAYALVHNQLTLDSGFDLEVLASELERIVRSDMGIYGFDEKKMDKGLSVGDLLPDEAKMVECPRCGHRQEA